MSATRVPEFFKESAAQIAQNLVYIITRSYQLDEHNLFFETAKAMVTLIIANGDACGSTVPTVIPIIMDILKKDVVVQVTNL